LSFVVFRREWIGKTNVTKPTLNPIARFILGVGLLDDLKEQDWISIGLEIRLIAFSRRAMD